MSVRASAASPPAESEGDGDRADEERAAGVTEFPADLGGAHGLSEPFRWCGSGEMSECNWGGQPGAGADQHRGEQDAADPGKHSAGQQPERGHPDTR